MQELRLALSRAYHAYIFFFYDEEYPNKKIDTQKKINGDNNFCVLNLLESVDSFG
jgi:hypothetical protein